MNIVLCFQLNDKERQQILQASHPDHVIVSDQASIAVDIMEADIFCGHARAASLQPPIDWQQVIEQGRLRWIQSSAAGMDHCLVPPVIASDVLVSSASGLFRNQVAEQTMALLYGLIRNLPTFFRQAQAKDFTRRPTDDLHGKSIGILGFGGNGQRIAELLLPVAGRIIATDRYVEAWQTHFPLPPIDELWPDERTDELFAVSDVVIVTLPLDPSTHHVVTKARLESMPAGSYLINVGRGPLVDETSLIEVLESGHLAGAGLDVTEQEPLPMSSPLWELPNVLISPHVGAQSANRSQVVTDLFCENLERFRTSKKLKNVVDKQISYPFPQDRL